MSFLKQTTLPGAFAAAALTVVTSGAKAAPSYTIPFGMVDLGDQLSISSDPAGLVIDPQIGTLSSNGETVYVGAQSLMVTDLTNGNSFNIAAACVTVGNVTPGTFSNVLFNVTPIDEPPTADQLARLATGVVLAGPVDSAAYQAAIWELGNPATTTSGLDAQAQTDEANYVAIANDPNGAESPNVFALQFQWALGNGGSPFQNYDILVTTGGPSNGCPIDAPGCGGTTIPEPGSLALLGVGVLGLGMAVRRGQNIKGRNTLSL